jgi:hypothetical protein
MILFTTDPEGSNESGSGRFFIVKAQVLKLKDVLLTSCPGVSDVDGLVYWSQTDESGGVRVYQEDRHHGHWTIQAQNREDLGELSFRVPDPRSCAFLTPGSGFPNP